MLESLVAGLVLGLSAGFSPSPHMTFVITHTLRHDIGEGIKVALAPLITDAPIILLALFVLSRLSNFNFLLGIISIAGGLFLTRLAYRSVRTQPVEITVSAADPQSLRQGATVSLLNPNAYIFWFTVGAPTVLKAAQVSIGAAAAFVLGFYLMLIGSRVLLAIVVGKSRAFLQGNIYIYTMRVLGVVLFLFALLLFREGLGLLGVIPL